MSLTTMRGKRLVADLKELEVDPNIIRHVQIGTELAESEAREFILGLFHGRYPGTHTLTDALHCTLCQWARKEAAK